MPSTTADAAPLMIPARTSTGSASTTPIQNFALFDIPLGWPGC